MAETNIRPAQDRDFEAIWPFLREVIRAGEVYAIDRDLSREAAFDLWMKAPHATYVAENGGGILGIYYIKANFAGGAGHVCNGGYMVAPAARGQGIATKMCVHSQDTARGLGYRAMQFNIVLESNEGAFRLWQKLGFDTVGRLPQVFEHPKLGLIDANVMFKWLEPDSEN